MQCVVVESVRNYHCTLLYDPEEHSFWNLFFPPIPLMDGVGVLDRISEFGSIGNAAFLVF